MFSQLDERHAYAKVLRDKAYLLYLRGQPAQALQDLEEKVLPWFVQLDDKQQLAEIKGQIADILFLQDEQETAFDIYEKEVLPVYEKLGDKRMLLVAQVNLAIQCLQSRQNLEYAKELLITALQSARDMQIPEASQIEAVLQQIGIVANNVNDANGKP